MKGTSITDKIWALRMEIERRKRVPHGKEMAQLYARLRPSARRRIGLAVLQELEQDLAHRILHFPVPPSPNGGGAPSAA